MSVAAPDLRQYVDKKITLVRNLAQANDKGETAEELEGTLMAVAGEGVMFKPKGKTSATIINISEIERVDFLETGIKKLSAKPLKIVQFGQARNHLLERHGFTIAKINGMPEKEAFDLHSQIDHVGSDLGHVHKDKSEDKAEEGNGDEE